LSTAKGQKALCSREARTVRELPGRFGLPAPSAIRERCATACSHPPAADRSGRLVLYGPASALIDRLLATAALGVGVATARAADDKKDKEKPEEEVGAAEDLMREHGVLNRVLLIYEEGLRRLAAKEEVPPEVFHRAATLVRKFVEDYHERLEEKFIFPEFEKRRKHTDLVKVLLRQHEAGRALTDVVLRNAAPAAFRREEARRELSANVRAFIRMYRPHEAREDTVLFPALHKIVPARQLKDLGEQFEKEDRLSGDEGFEKTVDQVAAVEKQLGIYDLTRFTPRLPVK
jgi:hemerythrin-like domain-containing protein